LEPDEFLKRHKHTQKSWEDYLGFEKKVQAPEGKYRLISLTREESLPYSVEAIIGIAVPSAVYRERRGDVKAWLAARAWEGSKRRLPLLRLSFTVPNHQPGWTTRRSPKAGMPSGIQYRYDPTCTKSP
jgi:hypothetical protein